LKPALLDIINTSQNSGHLLGWLLSCDME
jgi:hypothetical protein